MVKGKPKKKQGKQVGDEVQRAQSRHEGLGLPMTLFLASVIALLSYFVGVVFRHQTQSPNPFTSESLTPVFSTESLVSFERTKISQCHAREFLADVPSRGLHITCAQFATDGQSVQLKVFPNSQGEGEEFLIPLPEPLSLSDLRETLETRLSLQSRTVNPWAFFSPDGMPLESLKAILEADTALIFEGGTFMWPGIRIGHNQSVSVGEHGERVTLQTLSLQPLVFSIEDFLTADECEYIQTQANPHMKQSGVSLMDKDRGKQATEWRTSSTYFMTSKTHPPLQIIDRRVARLTRTPMNQQELVQVLKYGESQKYDAHHDYFDPNLYKRDPQTLKLTKNGKMNRMATVLWYLSDVEDGGHTIFPRFNGRRTKNMTDCSGGLKVGPAKGKVIMFYSLLPTGEGDVLSLHGACPVIGQSPKWAANKWIWNGPLTLGDY